MFKNKIDLLKNDTSDWNDFVINNDGNILQSKEWGILKSNYGWEYEIVVIKDNNFIKGGALILYKKLPLGIGTIAYIPRGPVIDWDKGDLLVHLMGIIQSAAKNKRAWAIWIEPELQDLPENRTTITKLGYRQTTRTIQPAQTIMMDISIDEQSILSRMKQKTRYNIRLAEKKDVVIRQATVNDAESFHNIMTETGNRDNFSIHSSDYYKTCLEIFSTETSCLDLSLTRGKSVFLLAEYEGQPIAAIILLVFGTMAWYFYGASSSNHREKMPAYALQWHAIQWAKSQGCSLYDLWGIPVENVETLESEFENRNDGLWGVYRFKRGFGGQVFRHIGLWELPLNPFYLPIMNIWNRISTNQKTNK